jgi:hypothetical protein
MVVFVADAVASLDVAGGVSVAGDAVASVDFWILLVSAGTEQHDEQRS